MFRENKKHLTVSACHYHVTFSATCSQGCCSSNSSVCLHCHHSCLYFICSECLFASFKCQASRAAACWIIAIKTESTYVHTRRHTHYSLSRGASCPDCVNPLCPPRISLHPSTSTPLWWRHTHTLTTLHHYHCFSWRRVSAFVCNYRGLKWKRIIFKKRAEDGWKSKKRKKNTPLCLWHISHILP